jgi:hypothetical protein
VRTGPFFRKTRRAIFRIDFLHEERLSERFLASTDFRMAISAPEQDAAQIKRVKSSGPEILKRFGVRQVEVEICQRNGVYDRSAGPAFLVFNAATGQLLEEAWYRGGREHRIGAPARREWFAPSGELKRESWMVDGRLHRDGGAAEQRFHSDLTLASEVWAVHGTLHREDGPARTVRLASGVYEHLEWCLAGKRHRVGGPAVVARDYCTGRVTFELWAREGVPFREDGPAAIWCETDGRPVIKEWWGPAGRTRCERYKGWDR